jgi:hypothetical protein
MPAIIYYNIEVAATLLYNLPDNNDNVENVEVSSAPHK